MSTAKENYETALRDAANTVDRLGVQGREDRILGLSVAIDLGTNAAFLFGTSDSQYEDATKIVRESIAQAIRSDLTYAAHTSAMEFLATWQREYLEADDPDHHVIEKAIELLQETLPAEGS